MQNQQQKKPNKQKSRIRESHDTISSQTRHLEMHKQATVSTMPNQEVAILNY